MNLVPIHGKFIFDRKANMTTFEGGELELDPTDNVKNDPWATIGLVMSDKKFSEGTIKAEVIFKKPSNKSLFEIITFYNPDTKGQIGATLSNSRDTYQIRIWNGQQYIPKQTAGTPGLLEAGKSYIIEVDSEGSQIRMRVDGVEVLKTDLALGNLPISQAGFFCSDYNNIIIKNFEVHPKKTKAFIIMQYSSPFNDIYEEVIKSVCKSIDLIPVRIDEVPGPRIIVNDLMKEISHSKIVIADISPANPNVYYEVGYAHAKNKPTILLALKGTLLPFDVSPFRTIFYEDTISGKGKLEIDLKKHLTESLVQEGSI